VFIDASYHLSAIKHQINECVTQLNRTGPDWALFCAGIASSVLPDSEKFIFSELQTGAREIQ